MSFVGRDMGDAMWHGQIVPHHHGLFQNPVIWHGCATWNDVTMLNLCLLIFNGFFWHGSFAWHTLLVPNFHPTFTALRLFFFLRLSTLPLFFLLFSIHSFSNNLFHLTITLFFLLFLFFPFPFFLFFNIFCHFFAFSHSLTCA